MRGKLYERDGIRSGSTSSLAKKKKEINDNNDEDEEDELTEDSEAASALRNAWNELAAIERETKRYRDIRASTEKELEDCRNRGVSLEDVRR